MDKFEKENAERYQRGRRLTLMHASYWPISDCSVFRSDRGGDGGWGVDGDAWRDQPGNLHRGYGYGRVDHLACAQPGPV